MNEVEAQEIMNSESREPEGLPVATGTAFYRYIAPDSPLPFGMACYVMSDGTLRRMDTLEPWEPTPNHVREDFPLTQDVQ
jgi:hypothetical protein